MCVCCREHWQDMEKVKQLHINGLENIMNVKAETPVLPPSLGICQAFKSKNHSKHINTQVIPSSELILLSPGLLCHNILSLCS